MQKLNELSAPLGRLLIAQLYIMAGINKIFNYAGTQGYMEAMGVSGSLLALVILLEIGGGLALLLGWHTRLAAFLLAGFTVIAALIFHSNFADQMQMIMFMKNVAITGALLMIIHHGPGSYALDNVNQTAK